MQTKSVSDSGTARATEKSSIKQRPSPQNTFNVAALKHNTSLAITCGSIFATMLPE